MGSARNRDRKIGEIDEIRTGWGDANQY